MSLKYKRELKYGINPSNNTISSKGKRDNYGLIVSEITREFNFGCPTCNYPLTFKIPNNYTVYTQSGIGCKNCGDSFTMEYKQHG